MISLGFPKETCTLQHGSVLEASTEVTRTIQQVSMEKQKSIKKCWVIFNPALGQKVTNPTQNVFQPKMLSCFNL